MIIVQRIFGLSILVIAPAHGHHLNFTLNLVIPNLIARPQIENMNHRPPLETFARTTLRVLDEDCGQKILVSVNGHLHHAALHLIALPQRIAREQINSLNARLAPLLQTQEQNIRARHRRNIRLIPSRRRFRACPAGCPSQDRWPPQRLGSAEGQPFH